MPRLAGLSMIIVATTLSGCVHNSHSHGGHLISDYAPGDNAKTRKTPYRATYVLMHRPSPPTNPPPHTWNPDQQVCELYVRTLKKREKIGFEKDSDGKLFAVAGEEKILLEDGKYCWHVSSQERFPMAKWMIAETNDTVLGIVTLPFSLVALALVVPMLALAGLFIFPFFLFAA